MAEPVISDRILPERMIAAIEGKQAACLRLTVAEAREALREDAALLKQYELMPIAEVRVTRGEIRFTSGGRIRYFGGSTWTIDQQLRGLRLDHIDGQACASPQAIFYTLGVN